jgi:hypothetical protein
VTELAAEDRLRIALAHANQLSIEDGTFTQQNVVILRDAYHAALSRAEKAEADLARIRLMVKSLINTAKRRAFATYPFPQIVIDDLHTLLPKDPNDA